MNGFENLGVSDILAKKLNDLKICIPTAIQEKTIPIALKNVDILGSAQTGTGKTLAFVIPLLMRLFRKEIKKGLIIEPTRELAQQVLDTIKKLLECNDFIKYVLLIGGEPYEKQLRVLKFKPHIYVGTPGRIIDHLRQGNIKLDDCGMLILDETDKMFDMGFYEQLKMIFSRLSKEKQTLMFSATFSKEIEEIAGKYLINPERIFVQVNAKANIIANNLVQESIKVKRNEKYSILKEQLDKREGKKIVFVRTKSDVEMLRYRLKNDGYNVAGIHGDMPQRKRKKVTQLYRQGICDILIATGVISRGFDVPDVMHVINYSIPDVPEDYIHRIGRTARAGASGYAISFIDENDEKAWHNIQCMLHPELKNEKNIQQKRNNFRQYSRRQLKFSRQNGFYRRNNNFRNFNRKCSKE